MSRDNSATTKHTVIQLALVLHAHLPFVRHPEHERFLEESWLFEAVADCYLPLLEVLEGWVQDGVRARLTVSISPTLLTMWEDPLLRSRCARYLEGRVELAEREVQRTLWLPDLHRLAGHYHERFDRVLGYWSRLGGDLTGCFRRLQEAGMIEVMTTSATHAVLPLLAGDTRSLRAQVVIGCGAYRRAFGRAPAGFWLPECAWAGSVGEALRAAGVRWTAVDTHGVIHGSPRPKRAVYAPIRTSKGLAVFGRDVGSARQVWSRESGYPGDPRYRDFYRDAGWDLDMEYVRSFLPTSEHRGFTGLKYHAIGRPGQEKPVYDPAAASDAVRDQAGHFVEELAARGRELLGKLGGVPVLVAPYDAELFGHWWHEGPAFLDAVLRRIASGEDGIELVTPAEVVEGAMPCDVVEPATSSWGDGGYFGVWLGERNAWIQPELRDAGLRMGELARRFPVAEGLRTRALRQAGRELLLAQASDWPFMLHNRTSADYAEARIRGHLARFNTLAELLIEGREEEEAAALEAEVTLFPDLDWGLWG